MFKRTGMLMGAGVVIAATWGTAKAADLVRAESGKGDSRPAADLTGVSVCEGGWESAAPYPVPVAEACAVVHQGSVYVFGDSNWSPNNNRVYRYDPSINTWTRLENMPTGRGQAAAAVVGDRIYVIGGNDCPSNCWLRTVEAYDIPTNTWITNIPDLPGAWPRGWLTAVSVNGYLYVLGGVNSYHVPTSNENYRFDPASSTWTAMTAMPRPRAHHSATVLDGKIYVAGGQFRFQDCGDVRFPQEVDVFVPGSNTWQQTVPIPQIGIDNLQLVSVNERIVAIGGVAGDCGPAESGIDTVVEFRPALGCWTYLSRIPARRGRVAAVAVDSELIHVGGYNYDVGLPTVDVFRGVPTQIPGDMNNDGWLTVGDIGLFVSALVGQ